MLVIYRLLNLNALPNIPLRLFMHDNPLKAPPDAPLLLDGGGRWGRILGRISSVPYMGCGILPIRTALALLERARIRGACQATALEEFVTDDGLETVGHS